jgi:hypothetical protein
MRNAIVLSMMIFLLAACKKDKYTTKPQLKYEGVNTKQLRSGEVINFRLSFTDAEGDLTDSIFIIQFSKNCAASNLPARKYQIPEFPTTKNQKGEIRVTLGYNVQTLVPIANPACNRNDTTIFKFVLKDKAQNVSDTAFSDQIIIYR